MDSVQDCLDYCNVERGGVAVFYQEVPTGNNDCYCQTEEQYDRIFVSATTYEFYTIGFNPQALNVVASSCT